MTLPHLIGASIENAPIELLAFAQQNGAREVYFVDDKDKCKRSIRHNDKIWINTRCTFWDAMIPPPFCCHDVYDAILLRFLHEVGHVFLKHPGDPGLRSTVAGLQLPYKKDFFQETFTGPEGEAWEFALGIRKQDHHTFMLMHDACNKWYQQHNYETKDWDEEAKNMWLRVQGQPLVEAIFSLPDWVVARFGVLLPDHV